MQQPIQTTPSEAAAEHPATHAGVAVTAAVANAIASGNPLDVIMYAAGLALLPSLYTSISSKRIQSRNEAAIRTIRDEMENLKEEIKNFTDPQFGFISETIVSVHASHEAAKLAYLKNAILRAARNGELVEKNGALLARILRDITAAEILFVHDHFGTKLGMAAEEGDTMPDVKLVLKDTDEAATLAGLISLGLVSGAADNPWDFTYFEWTRTAARILTLVKD